MSEITWTPEELDEFDKLIDEVSSRNQVARIAGRFAMKKFIADHGQKKCDAMWLHLQERDGAKK